MPDSQDRSEPQSYELPIFALGTVAFPTGAIPLHVFEARYRAMVRDVVAGDGCFGVVLITRGSEVGGGDVRSTVGTKVRISQSHDFVDGRSALIAIGETVFDVDEWLVDDPYPRALVRERSAETARVADPQQALFRARLALLDVYELAVDLGRLDTTPVVAWDDAPDRALWQLGLAAPLGPADQYELLALETAEGRVAKITGLLEAIRSDLLAEHKLR